MKKLGFLILSILILRQTASAQSESLTLQARSLKERNDALTYDWKTAISGLSTTSETAQSKLVDFRLEFKVLYKLNSYLNLDFQPALKFQSSNQQTLDAADKPDNKILLNQAAVNFTPVYFLTASAGALNQSFLHTSLLVDDIPFPAARADVTIFKGDSTQFDMFAESAIPTTSSLSPNTNEVEQTPSLNSAALRLRVQTNRVEWLTTGGYFSYSDLPSSVAAKSYLLGNTVQMQSDTQGLFKYRYEGYEAKTRLKIGVLRGVDLFTGGEYLQNSKAPSGLNSASMLFAGSDIYLKKGLSLMMSGGYFRIEPDATVAFFSPSVYFNTNRVGYMAESYLNFKKESFRIGLRYSEAEAMYVSPVQNRERAFLLRLETTYADNKG